MEFKVMQEFKKLLGPRISSISTGGGAIDREVLEFLRRCFSQAMVVDGYGATEAGRIARDGILSTTLDYYLEAVPELGYDPNGNPPRGELIVKTVALFDGYYKDDNATDKSLTPDGYYRTGDLVELSEHRTLAQIIDPNAPGHTKKIKIIGRRNQALKLPQGEFIVPETLEQRFLSSPYISLIYVHADRLKDNLVAVVVPNYKSFLILENIKIEPLMDDASAKKVYKKIIDEINTISDRYQIPKYSRPTEIHLEKDNRAWERNNLLTTTSKLSRPKLAQYYAKEIAKIYEMIKEREKLASLTKAFKSILPSEVDDEKLHKSDLLSLGADSVSMVKLQQLIKFNLNMEITVKDIYELGSFDRLARKLISPNISFDTASSISDPTGQINHKVNIDYENLVRSLFKNPLVLEMEDLKSSYLSSLPRATWPPKAVLLTGATGFLGSHLLMELLNVAYIESVYLLVRGRDHKSVLDTLRSKISDSGFEVPKYFESKIKLVFGDMSDEKLGLSQESWTDLAENVDLVLHNAALVSSVLPYSELERHNVAGVSTLIHLCVEEKLKRFSYVSSLSATFGDLYKEKKVDPTVKADALYLSNYGKSKYEGERLLAIAESFGLSVVVTRPATITGTSNLNDFSNMLMRGVIELGSYPALFGHTNWVPVEFCADVITRISLTEKTYGSVFHISNPNGDISYDFIFTAIQSFGYDLEAVSIKEFYNLLAKKPDVPLYRLLERFNGSQGSPDPYMPATIKFMKESDISCEPLNEALIHRYLKIFASKGLTPKMKKKKTDHKS